MLEGPDSRETEEDQECVITPSTSVKFNAALRERNRINFMKNHLLLIGRHPKLNHKWPHARFHQARLALSQGYAQPALCWMINELRVFVCVLYNVHFRTFFFFWKAENDCIDIVAKATFNCVAFCKSIIFVFSQVIMRYRLKLTKRSLRSFLAACLATQATLFRRLPTTKLKR